MFPMLRTLLHDDVIKAAYHIALLEEPYSASSQWSGHRNAQGEIDGVAAFYKASRPSVIFLLGDPSGVASCITSAELPAKACAAYFPEHEEPLSACYRLEATRQMSRMVLRKCDFAGVLPQGDYTLARLGLPDLPALQELYLTEPSFNPDPYQFASGRYIGIYDGHTLLASAGTHFLNYAYSFAMMGNVFTHPDHRGKGLARLAVAALAERLFDEADVICLNVRSANRGAAKLYESLGFSTHCTYLESAAVLHKRALVPV